MGHVFLGRYSTTFGRNLIDFSDTAGQAWLTGPIFGVDDWNYGMEKDPWAINGIITRIEAIGIESLRPGLTTPEDIIWLVQVYRPDLGLYRHYYYKRIGNPAYYSGKVAFYPRFDSWYTPDASLDVQELQVVGTSTIRRLIIFAGSAQKDDGTWTSRMKITSNGWDWQDINFDAIKIIDDNGIEQHIVNPFVSDVYIKALWSGGICHNHGKWLPNGIVERGLSYDMEICTQIPDYKKNYNIASIAAINQKTDYNLSLLQIKENKASVTLEMLAKKKMEKPVNLLSRAMIKQRLRLTTSGAIAIRPRKDYNIHEISQKKNRIEYEINSLYKGKDKIDYDISTNIVTDRLALIILRIERYSAQEWWLVPEQWPAKVWRSQDEGIEI
jgi:hypothetical protein